MGVPEQSVVLRRESVTIVEVTWSGRRSDPDCSRSTAWAVPGYYHVAAAAMGSEPEEQQFRLLPPAPVTITPTPTPLPEKAEKDKSDKDQGNGSTTPGKGRGQDRSGNGERDHPADRQVDDD